VAERAAVQLTERYPGATVTGLPAPRIERDGSMDVAALEPIREAAPDIVCVALGNPKQEHWIERHGAAVGAPVFIGVGGSLDFLTGVTRRAPGWMQRSGLEWLHRALSEPRRLIGRYATDLLVFGPALLTQMWRGRSRRRAATAPIVETSATTCAVRYVGPASTAAVDSEVLQHLRPGVSVSVDLSTLSRLDNVTVAAAVSLVRAARRRGATVRGATLPSALRGEARRLGVDGLLGDPAGVRA
jgi:N-acetylglucosaminyldiphosphoundecaprenol N-acetyl-beta-D-mannosaminyltransferase